MTPDYTATPVLEARGISKYYGRITALDHADFAIYPGEIVAIVGDNGAGKSTLTKIISGALVPDTGSVLLNGQPVHLQSPLDAREHGIETVYQTLAVAPALDIASNLFLGREKRVRGILGTVFRKLDKRGMHRQAHENLSTLKIGLNSTSQLVETLSGGQRQGVAVARAISWSRKVVIMDEPTAALGVQESSMVLDLIRQVRARGIPVAIISHDMPQVFKIADRVQVMRLGCRAGTAYPSQDSMEDVVGLITGARTQQKSEADMASES
ncbi:sugar ABC transporter ATP-binding protein [Salinisphaera sp. USBA-960]|uniref:ATP-binding cassette domain-containing protein n=1 Tax=Salinisphaera orenii TaxID=856731 RepID=UPI000DBE0914|nr:sugar ABC transporter ATP-binding protein [Salifodinibacter halophilus]NNC25892.1 sugar ABC transporter ATP-binding protein [Salifodinibacter halophilus]